MATKIIITEKQLKKIVNKHLKEDYWQAGDDDKWNSLEKDLRFVVDKIIDKHKSKWGNDQYAVIGAIEQIFEGMFAKVGR
tara:strand:- start:1031 stop:1270 length:240 start_codon:yes stop_codon:yes gene_type:complete